MRNVILGVGISLDGYVARLNGAVDFLFMPKDYSMEPFLATVDAAVMGRKTLDAALEMGATFGDASTPTYVFSRSLAAGKRDGLTFVRESPAALIAKLRRKPGKNVWLMGGGELTREFLKADLVDGMYLGMVPVLLGDGIPLFPRGFPQRDFELVENKSHSQGLIALTFKRVRKAAAPKKR